MSVYLEVSKDNWTNGLQLSVNDENGGYRIKGPKFNGSQKTLLKADLSVRDATELRRYCDRVIKENSK